MSGRPSAGNLLGGVWPDRRLKLSMQVTIPQPLLSYTEQADRVEAEGQTLNALLKDLDRQYPGIRFRMVNEQDEMRPNIIFFVDGQRTRNIEEPLARASEVVILHALSGG